MGNISSHPEEQGSLYIRDQNRFSFKALTIANSRQNLILEVSPNSFPATRLSAKRDIGDDKPVEYIQDPATSLLSSPSSFLLRLQNDDELNFSFSFVIRQGQGQTGDGRQSVVDTTINGLTFAFASNKKDLDTLVTREFQDDINIHKNANVELVRSTCSTSGSSSVQLDWQWTWRPPKVSEDKGGGWRNTCTFAEYDQRAHRLNPLATFSFWVHSSRRSLGTPLPSPNQEFLLAPRLRVPSSQSAISAMGESEAQSENRDAPSPVDPTDNGILQAMTTAAKEPVKLDVLCQRPGEDISAVEDGPLFRATMKALEQKTSSMRTQMKKVLRRAEAAQTAQAECNDAVAMFMEALREASASNANAVQPALEHYFEKIAKQILMYERQNTITLQKLIIDPLTKIYTNDIKQAESKKKEFEDESKDYYSYVSRYLGQRQDSLKEKKRIESDSKYQAKRKNFELKRFDYSSFMQDLHGGRKEQEVLSFLTRYADSQAKSYLATAKKVDEMVPQLDALIREVGEADKEFRFQRTEREEKRRTIEMSTANYTEPEASTTATSTNNGIANGTSRQEGELNHTGSNNRTSLHHKLSTTSDHGSVGGSTITSSTLAPSPSVRSVSGTTVTSPAQDKFKGIRDLEEKSHYTASYTDAPVGQQRKEGLLWALSRPGSHVDPRGLNKQAWHKFWIVLDQGRLSEYSNWKERLDLHMDPIDLRVASVREARNAERRFCFEVITPSFKRVYQATSEEDMNNWINSINNALQSAFESRKTPQHIPTTPTNESSSLRRDIGSVLTGKAPPSSLYQNHHTSPSNNNNNMAGNVYRRTTVGARPSYSRTASNNFDENPSKLLQTVRDIDQGNNWCADCGSGVRTEWVSINLGIVLCIECSGIHRSLGTHISKVRSLTLDTTSFTTDIVELLLQVGNRISNMVWEAKLDPSKKLNAQATRDQRLKFITEKYVERVFINPISSTLSHYSTADETLLASIKKNEIQGVLYALALRANPNATDRSRNTHAIFLALAAADPASPNIISSSSSTTTSSLSLRSSTPTPPKVVAFPVAELLVQNGGEIPSTPPAFPLSPAAQLYVDQKTKKNTIDSSGDTLTALPMIKTTPTEKERERLQKRVSAGGRLVARAAGL